MKFGKNINQFKTNRLYFLMLNLSLQTSKNKDYFENLEKMLETYSNVSSNNESKVLKNLLFPTQKQIVMF